MVFKNEKKNQTKQWRKNPQLVFMVFSFFSLIPFYNSPSFLLHFPFPPFFLAALFPLSQRKFPSSKYWGTHLPLYIPPAPYYATALPAISLPLEIYFCLFIPPLPLWIKISIFLLVTSYHYVLWNVTKIGFPITKFTQVTCRK